LLSQEIREKRSSWVTRNIGGGKKERSLAPWGKQEVSVRLISAMKRTDDLVEEVISTGQGGKGNWWDTSLVK